MRKGPLESPAPRSAPEATMDAPNRGSAKATMRSTWLPSSMDLGVLGEDLDQLGGEQEQHRPAQGHNAHAHPGDHPGEALGQVLPAGAHGLAHQGGARHGHAGGRQGS